MYRTEGLAPAGYPDSQLLGFCCILRRRGYGCARVLCSVLNPVCFVGRYELAQSSEGGNTSLSLGPPALAREQENKNRQTGGQHRS